MQTTPMQAFRRHAALDWHIRESIRLRYPIRHETRDKVLLELACARALTWQSEWTISDNVAIDFDILPETISQDQLFWEDVEQIVNRADDAVTRSNESEEASIARWKHQPPADLDISDKLTNDQSAILDDLADCASIYLRSQWANSPSLEIWLSRKMIHAEAFAFARETGMPLTWKSPRYWWLWSKSLVKWLIGVAVAFGVGGEQGLAFGLLTYVAWIAMLSVIDKHHVTRIEKPAMVFLQLRHVYRRSLHPNLAPVELYRMISSSERDGAIWPVGLVPLVMRAMARCKWKWAD